MTKVESPKEVDWVKGGRKERGVARRSTGRKEKKCLYQLGCRATDISSNNKTD